MVFLSQVFFFYQKPHLVQIWLLVKLQLEKKQLIFFVAILELWFFFFCIKSSTSSSFESFLALNLVSAHQKAYKYFDIAAKIFTILPNNIILMNGKTFVKQLIWSSLIRWKSRVGSRIIILRYWRFHQRKITGFAIIVCFFMLT